MLSPENRKRYQRQIGLSEIQEQGQEQLGRSRVLLVGLGGLGSAIAASLCAAGVGFLRIVDSDRVELSNLNRQMLHWTGDVGREKTTSAREKLAAMNPEVVLDPRQIVVTRETVLELLRDCQVIIDGTDTLASRRILNRASLKTGLPLIYGGINGFNGMLSTFIPGRTPCFECLFSTFGDIPEPPSVLGATAGMVGSLQSLEAIKYLLGMHEHLLAGRLLLVQGRSMAFREIRLEPNPACPECGAKTRAPESGIQFTGHNAQENGRA
jgi:adenylyltransferase/sulfurtransferase